MGEEKRTTNKNPFERVNIIANLFFVWTFPLFYKGVKKGIGENDIYSHLSSDDSEALGEQLEKEWLKEAKKKQPSLFRALFKVFGKKMAFLGVACLIFELIRLTMPLTLARLLEYFEPNSTLTKQQAFMFAGALSIATFLQATIIQHTMFRLFHTGMKIRVAVVALVYRKAIRLSKSALAETTVGQMVNLISTDVTRFESCTINTHFIWIGPCQMFILMYLVYLNCGWTGMSGIGILVCIIVFQIWLAKKTSVYRYKTALKTDERIRLMNEIISGIQVIKMYTWERPFIKVVEMVRRLEIKQIRNNSVIKSINIAFNVFLTRVMVYFCILIYILLGNTISAQYVFSLTLFYEFLRQCLSQAFAQGMIQLAEVLISARRIKSFLLYDEIEQPPLWPSLSNKQTSTGSLLFTGSIRDASSPVEISLQDVSTKWVKSSTENNLENVNFNLKSGEMAMVIGKVGSGKSTLLHVLLRELPPTKGTIKINGVISYASQEPWLFVGNVRDNILFGQEYDVVKYREVIRVCALERDLTLFPYGDKTLIGERGVSLSGGQRARINLARAIYKEADIYLLDDPLAAVDAHVGKQIFKECISGYLKDKCVVLVTHQLQYLKDCKQIYLMNNGTVQQSGTYEDIKNAGEEFNSLLEELRRMEEEAKKEAEEEEKRKRRRTLSAKGGNDENEAIEGPAAEKEEKMSGTISFGLYKKYFLAGGSAFKIFCLVAIYLISQAVASCVDYFLGLWVNFIQLGNVSNNTQTGEKTQTVWSTMLTEDTGLIVYTVLIIVGAPLILGRGILFFNTCMTASINLHNTMFSKIVYAPMRFFNVNPSGRILNRFSKDMNLVDEFLPSTLGDFILMAVMIVAQMIVVSIIQPLILIPAAVMFVIFYVLRIVFVATSRELKRFEAIARSPVYSYLTASLQGLTTIRAFGTQQFVKKQFDNHQNLYSSIFFMYLAANRAFAFWLDVCTCLFVATVIFSFLLLQTGSAVVGGSVGLAITQVINISNWFQYGLRQWGETENMMTSVERVKEYADIIPERDLSAKDPPKNWPQAGEVEFTDLSLRYDKNEPPVLKELNFLIKPKEKVGIVGRTGAGKSSIISALFRLADIDGQILIDGVDSKSVALDRLRSSISIIPQEPVLFSGSLRKNLDPFDEYDDEALWSALEQVELKKAIQDLPHGLESKISEGGSNFSVGQRQLVCLARAIVRNNKILVLDEATASVDPHTDNLIQKTIRRKFVDCTVLTIAHRLNTIMDSDKVLVMDAGRKVEFDHPYVLLNAKGVFYELVEQTGKAMAKNLLQIATKSYGITEKDAKET